MEPADVHVIPQNDLRPHEVSKTCWCHPLQDDDCDKVWVHNAMDQRELFEEGERKAS